MQVVRNLVLQKLNNKVSEAQVCQAPNFQNSFSCLNRYLKSYLQTSEKLFQIYIFKWLVTSNQPLNEFSYLSTTIHAQ